MSLEHYIPEQILSEGKDFVPIKYKTATSQNSWILLNFANGNLDCYKKALEPKERFSKEEIVSIHNFASAQINKAPTSLAHAVEITLAFLGSDHLVSLNSPVTEKLSEERELADTLEDPTINVEEQGIRDYNISAIKKIAKLTLSKTHYETFEQRFVEDLTQAEIGRQLKMTRENIGSREKKSLTKLKSHPLIKKMGRE